MLAVLDYLHRSGWEISQAGLYKHVHQGKLAPGKDKTFDPRVIDRYAKAYLRPAQQEKPKESPDDKLIMEAADARRRKDIAQAVHWETKTKKLTGEYVSRDFHERELAARIIVLRTDLEHFARAAAADAVHLVLSSSLAALHVPLNETLASLASSEDPAAELAAWILAQSAPAAVTETTKFLLSAVNDAIARYADAREFEVPTAQAGPPDLLNLTAGDLAGSGDEDDYEAGLADGE